MTGGRGRHVNTLRLWSARANDPIHLYAFNQGDFVGAMAAKGVHNGHARNEKAHQGCRTTL